MCPCQCLDVPLRLLDVPLSVSGCALAGFVAVALGTLPMVGIGLLVIALRMDIGALFINNGIIIGKVAAVVPICAAYLVVDAVNDTSSGILR